MSFFNQLQKGVDMAKFKANQLNRINKLQNDIASITGEVQSIRRQIVDTSLSLYRNNSELPSEISTLCGQIIGLEKKVNDIEQIINSVRLETYAPDSISISIPDKDNSKCPHCNMEIPVSAEFCIHCGKKI